MLTAPASAPAPAFSTLSASDSLERRVASLPSPTMPPSPSWEHLWFALLQHQWSSLALVPAQRGLDTLATARSLALVSQAYLDSPVTVLDATRIAPGDVAGRQRAAGERTAAGARVIVAAGSPIDRAASIPMARGADAAVLMVQLGNSTLADARRTLELIGEGHFLGAIAVRV